MPPALARLRRAFGPPEAGGRGHHRPRGEGGGTQTIVTVPLTARGRTADDADIRLLLEARLEGGSPASEIERVAHALVVPAALRWVRRRRLDTLRDDLGARLPEVEDAVRAESEALGAAVVAIDVVAAEHLLRSPSAGGHVDGDAADGPD